MKLKLIIAMVAAVCMVSAFSTPAKALDYFEFPAYTFPSMVDRDDINVQLSMCDKELHKWCTENTMNNADKKACFDVVKPTCVEWILQGQPASPSVADLQHHATLCNNAQFTSGLITLNEVVASVSIDFNVDENNALKLNICAMSATYDEVELNWIEEYKQFVINLGDLRAVVARVKDVAGIQPRYAFLDANLGQVAIDWVEFSNILVAMGFSPSDIVFIRKDPNLPPIGIDINKTVMNLGGHTPEEARIVAGKIFSVLGMGSELLVAALAENNVLYIMTDDDPAPRLMNAQEMIAYGPTFLENVLWHRDEDIILPQPQQMCLCITKYDENNVLHVYKGDGPYGTLPFACDFTVPGDYPETPYVTELGAWMEWCSAQPPECAPECLDPLGQKCNTACDDCVKQGCVYDPMTGCDCGPGGCETFTCKDANGAKIITCDYLDTVCLQSCLDNGGVCRDDNPLGCVPPMKLPIGPCSSAIQCTNIVCNSQSQGVIDCNLAQMCSDCKVTLVPQGCDPATCPYPYGPFDGTTNTCVVPQPK